MTKDIKKLVEMVAPYCSRIRQGSKHIVLYPKGSDKVLIMSVSPSDTNHAKHMFQEFKRAGIIIKELERMVK